MNWLANIKKGDEVAIRRGYVYCNYEIATIEHTTPKQIVVKGMHFWRVGGSIVGDSLASTRIVEPTPKIKEQVVREKCISTLKAMVWERIDTETLGKIAGILKAQEEAK